MQAVKQVVVVASMRVAKNVGRQIPIELSVRVSCVKSEKLDCFREITSEA